MVGMSTPSNNEIFVFAGFTLDARHRMLVGPDEVAIPISGRAFDTLLFLVEHPNELVDKQNLMQAIWPKQVVEENNLNQSILAVRRALGEKPGEHRFVVTVPGRGFRFVAEVTRRERLAPAPAAITTAITTRAKSRLRTAGGWVAGLATVAAVALAGYYSARHFAVHSAAAPPVEDNAVAVNKPSIAVLPFVNMSSDQEQEYFSDGLTEELSNQLAQINGLRVAGRTSSFSFKGKNEDLRVIGEKLGVNHLLEGSVRKDGKQLRITAQLINAADGSHVWSKTYEPGSEGIFAVQEQIAIEVAKALSITLGVPSGPLFDVGTTNVEAYDKYLRASDFWTRQGGAEGDIRAIKLYREAVALDPNFLRAWYELGTALQFEPVLAPGKATDMQGEPARTYAHVVSMAPSSWQAQTIGGLELFAQRKYAEAESAFKAAIALEHKSDSAAQGPYLGFLGYLGRIRDASKILEAEQRNDQLSLLVSGATQFALYAQGHRREAEAEYERSKDLSGDRTLWQLTALSMHWSHKDADLAAIAVELRAYLKAEVTGVVGIQMLPDQLADRSAAAAVIHRAFENPDNQIPTRMRTIAVLADHFGDKDLALVALRRASESLVDSMLWFPWETGLRADPRFKQIVRDLRFVDYWRATGNWSDFCHPVGEEDFECE
jgi:TolB-like protein/DNA-binding winged helix-turn-helix (wHTH) protein/tetratricopeptide (TPR) repeat protein